MNTTFLFSDILYCSSAASLFFPISVNLFLIGLPVTTAFSWFLKYLMDSSNVTKYLSTYLDNILLVTPGKLFCSWKATFALVLVALYNIGPLTYPPVPITRSGLNSLRILFASFNPLNNSFKALKEFAFIFLGIPLTCIVLKSIPSFGTILLSNPFSVPT